MRVLKLCTLVILLLPCVWLIGCDGQSESLVASKSTVTTDIQFPPAVSWTRADYITVRGQSQSDEVISELKVNGVNAVSDDGFSHWTAEIPLQTGQNRIVVDTVVQGDKIASEVNTTVIHRQILFGEIRAMDFDADLNVLYVLSAGSGSIIAVDLTTGKRSFVKPNLSPDDTGSPFRWAVDMVFDKANDRFIVLTFREIYSVDRSTGIVQNLFDAEHIHPTILYPFRMELADNKLWFWSRGLTSLDLFTGEFAVFGEDPALYDDPNFEPLEHSRTEGFAIDLASNRAFAPGADQGIIAEYRIDEQRLYPIEDSVSGQNRLIWPSDVAIDTENNRLLVTDSSLHALLAIDLATGQQSIISNSAIESPAGDLYGAREMCLDLPNHRVFVYDILLNDIFIIDLVTGERKLLPSEYGTVEPSRYGYANHIAASADSRVFVTDHGMQRISSLNLKTGEYEIITANQPVATGFDFTFMGSVRVNAEGTHLLFDDNTLVDIATGQRDLADHVAINQFDWLGRWLPESPPSGDPVINSDGTISSFSTDIDYLAFTGGTESSHTYRGEIGGSFQRMVLANRAGGAVIPALVMVDLETGDKRLINDLNSPHLFFTLAVTIDEINNNVIVSDYLTNTLMAFDVESGQSVYLSGK